MPELDACRVVLNTAINEYAVVMVRLLPWAPKTILDGGGNIGTPIGAAYSSIWTASV